MTVGIYNRPLIGLRQEHGAWQKHQRQDQEPKPFAPHSSIADTQRRVHLRVFRVALEQRARPRNSECPVFRDLGFPAEEAEHLLVRSDLMIKIQKLIVARRLKQAELAKVLRVTQARESDVLRGRIDLFSTDALIDTLARLGVRVRLVLKPGRRGLEAG